MVFQEIQIASLDQDSITISIQMAGSHQIMEMDKFIQAVVSLSSNIF